MTTARQLVEATKRHLYSGASDELNRLNGSITDSATSLTIELSSTGIARGSVLAIDLEEMYVWSVSGVSVTVQRGWSGSTAAAHADDAIVTVRPRFSDFRIFEAINSDIDDLSSPTNGLFQVEYVDLTYSSATQAYDLTSVTNMIGEPIEVLARASGSSKYWPRIRRWRFNSDQEAADFASGKSISLYEAGYTGNDIRVFYKAPFTRLTALADNVETVTGLPATAVDIPPLGAAEILLAGRPVKRSFTESQGETRRAEEVGVGDMLNSPSALRQRRRNRIIAESARLRALYPPMTHRVGL